MCWEGYQGTPGCLLSDYGSGTIREVPGDTVENLPSTDVSSVHLEVVAKGRAWNPELSWPQFVFHGWLHQRLHIEREAYCVFTIVLLRRRFCTANL